MKKPWMSKTLIVNVIVAIAAFIPGASEFVAPEKMMMVMSAINIVLRLVTKDKIGLIE